MQLPTAPPSGEFHLEHEDMDLGVMRVRCFRFADGLRDDARTIVCVHGMAASGLSFARVRSLASRYDFRFLSAPVDGYPGGSISSFAGAVCEYVDRLEGPVLMGTSWGGLVALVAAQESWRCLSGLVLTGAFARNTIVPRSLGIFEKAMILAQRGAPAFASISARVVGGFRIDRGALEELTRESREVTPRERTRRLGEVFAADLRKNAESIHVRSLVIHGMADRLVARRDARELARSLPKGVYREIAGAGHTPYLSHPEAFNEILSEFLERCMDEKPEAGSSGMASGDGTE